MDRLAGWTLPLLGAGGVLLAMKGSQAQDELDAASEAITRWGGGEREVHEVAVGGERTSVVRVVRETVVPIETATSKTVGRRKRR